MLHEKVKKGFVSHTAGRCRAFRTWLVLALLTEFVLAAYGLPVPEPQKPRIRVYQRTSDVPLATIHFEYRSRVLLEALGFTLPPPPQTLPEPDLLPNPPNSGNLKREAESSGAVAVKKEKRAKTDPAVKLETAPAKAYKVQNIGG